MIRTLIRGMCTLAVVAGAAALAACESDNSGDASTRAGVNMGAINDTCPIMTGNEVDPNATMADFEGTKVGFCCNGCISKWNTMSYAQKKQFLAQYQ